MPERPPELRVVTVPSMLGPAAERVVEREARRREELLANLPPSERERIEAAERELDNALLFGDSSDLAG